MLEPVTSLADLYYKARSNNLYARLIIIAATDLDLRFVEYNLEDAIKSLDERQQRNGCDDCNALVLRINGYRSFINSPQDNTMFIVKNREVADDARPRMNFNGENMIIAEGNGGYSRFQEGGRINRNNDHLVFASQIGVERENLEMSWVNPANGSRITINRTIHTDIPATIRAEIERDMHLELDRQIQESLRNFNERAHLENMRASFGDMYDDEICTNEEPCSICRSVNEDNPNHDR